MPLLPLKYAWRSLRRAPAFTSAATLTLALGIGAVCAIFSVINAVLLQPLPYRNAERLVALWHSALGLGVARADQMLATYVVYHRDNKTFDDMGAYGGDAANLSDVKRALPPERVQGAMITASLLPTLGASPILGRNITADEDRPGGAPVVLIGEGLWRRRFGATKEIVGHTITVDGAEHTVVGVMPAGFRFPTPEAQIWRPLRLDPSSATPGGFNYQAIGRLKPGVTIGTAEADLQQLLAKVPEEFPTIGMGVATADILKQGQIRAKATSLRDDVIGDFARVLWVIAGTAVLVLLVACVNVANLLLVRAEGRQKELAVRAALGAGRRRVLGHFLTEGGLLAALGGVFGIALAAAGVGVLVRVGPTLPRLAEVHIDLTTLLFAVLVTAVVALFCSALPAFRYSRVVLGAVLKEEGRGGTAGKTRQRARSTLVAAQVALSLVLLAGSGLLVRSVWRLRAVPLGFNPTNVLTLRIALTDVRYPHTPEVARFYGQLVDRLEAIPGVTAAGVVTKLPLKMDGANLSPVWVEDALPAAGALPAPYLLATASHAYFQAAGIPLLAGRAFEREDGRQQPNEVVLSRSIAEQYWKGRPLDEVVGRRVKTLPNGPWYTIVGVVESIRDTSLQTPATSAVYFPAVALPDSAYPHIFPSMNVVVRTAGDPQSAIPAVTREIHALDPSLPVFDVRPMTEVVSASIARLSFTLLILAVAAGVALVLGAIGLYGVIAYVVSMRTREIGVRMALGANPGEVGRMVAKQGVVLALAGVVVGLGVFFVVSRFLRTLLFEVSPVDPFTLAAVSGILMLVAMISSWVPAYRAARISPVEALRD